MAKKNPFTPRALERILSAAQRKLDESARYGENLGDAFYRTQHPYRAGVKGGLRQLRDRYDYQAARYKSPFKSQARDARREQRGYRQSGEGHLEDLYDEQREEQRKARDKAYAERQRRGGDYLRDIPREHGLTDLKVRRIISEADKIAGLGAANLRRSGQRLGTAQRGSQYLGLQQGALHGTLPQSTGALNGVMRGLAGLFILFVFISVFYMVFGPLYDVMTTNLLSIAAADGSTMLGGKDIATLYANTANAILIWVPLITIGGTLYLLISMVFERESKGLARTNEMLQWDALTGLDDDMDLDMALEGGFDPMGDFYGPS
tara:strand:+ start:115 stop:1074 length:960 start_codon:yes stop_codon:yes gene_type:complete